MLCSRPTTLNPGGIVTLTQYTPEFAVSATTPLLLTH